MLRIIQLIKINIMYTSTTRPQSLYQNYQKQSKALFRSHFVSIFDPDIACTSILSSHAPIVLSLLSVPFLQVQVGWKGCAAT